MIVKSRLLLLFVSLFISISAFAGTTMTGLHYKAVFDSGDTYDVMITPANLTWKGLTGKDKGKQQTSATKHSNITNDIEVIQWSEKTGSFITLVIDHTNLKIICSGIGKKKDVWLWNGTLEQLPV